MDLKQQQQEADRMLRCYSRPTIWPRQKLKVSFPSVVSVTGLTKFRTSLNNKSRSQWPRGLRRGSAAARLLGLWVRIPQEAWMFVSCECCVLSGRDLCDGLITRPEESYRLWCVVVCDLETSWMRRPWPTGGCCAKKQTTTNLTTKPSNKTVTKINQFWSLSPTVLRSVLGPYPPRCWVFETIENSNPTPKPPISRPVSWSSGQSFWLLNRRSRVRFPTLPWEFSL